MARPHVTAFHCRWVLFTASFFVAASQNRFTCGETPTPAESTPPSCIGQNRYQDAWIQVGERLCMKCHIEGGDASDSEFILLDEAVVLPSERVSALNHNLAVLTRLARVREENGHSRLLAKATGGLDHGGGEVLNAESTEFLVLREFVDSLEHPSVTTEPTLPPASDDLTSFFDGIAMISDQRLLRRITLSLASRLPTAGERQSVSTDGLAGIQTLLNPIMKEQGFEERLMEAFNDIFLTRGYSGNGEDVLSYDHFENTRHWYQKHSLEHLPEKDRQKARYKLADDYREALRREPMELIRYIVKEDRPFTEILTADYTMMSPYTARGYGMYDQLRDQFVDSENPFEFVPAKLQALTARSGKVQPTSDGIYPHAGLLSSFQYLRRYPTTETNRNRLRSRMYYQHFLGVDVMSLAPRVSDAAAIDAAYEVPTMQAADCVVCHTTLDPVAGLFQDYYNEDGHYGPRKEGWFTDMFGPGREGVDLTEDERWRALPWLAEQTVQDPRFSVAMAEHVFFILMGRRPLSRPDDISDPYFASRRRAYLVQREIIRQAAARFEKEAFNLKVIFEHLILSPLYRADALLTVIDRPDRRAELEDVGLVRLLSPEQIERKIQALFGKPWGRLTDSYAILYGGIDSEEVTERLTEPSGAIGAIQRILANDVACQNVAADFALPPGERRLFPKIELDVFPTAENPAAENQIRQAVSHLHQYILGRDDSGDGAELERSYQLFASIVAEAKSNGSYEPVESYFCKSGDDDAPRDPDPHYTLRAWRAVVTYLLRQTDFLYE